MEKRQNLTYANLIEVWPCHSKFKIREITGKVDFQFCKLTFLGVPYQQKLLRSKIIVEYIFAIEA